MEKETKPAQAPNCSALNKSTLICVEDATKSSITKITCVGGWGTLDLSIANGIIKPGQTTIVDFPSGKCTKHIEVSTKDGKKYSFDGFDTTANTVLIVDDGE